MRRLARALALLAALGLVAGSVGRTLAEEPPQVDAWTEVTFDLFTVDHVYVNQYGGITADGRIACTPLDPAPDDTMIVAGIWWDAIQYVGRKTAITAHAEWSRGVVCWESGVDGPTHWTTELRVTPQDGTGWIYSTDGKFGAGKIYIDAQANAAYGVTRQNVDPSGGDVPYDADCLDADGDGLCVFEAFYNSVFQAPMKAVRIR